MINCKFSKMHFMATLCAVAFIAIFATSSAVYAKEKPEIAQYLTPTHANIKLEPGTVYKDYFDIYNNGQKTFKIRVYATAYQVLDNDYREISYDVDNNYTAIKNWITFDQSTYTIKPDDFARIYYNVTVPKDTPAGGQYASLMSEIINEDTEGEVVTAVNRIGMILYAEVNGETHNEGYGQIINNTVNGFFLTPPITASSLVKNSGNVHAKATYTFSVYPLFSEYPAYTNEDEPDTAIVLPETSRFSTVSWKDSPKLGIFKIVQKIDFMGETSTIEKIVVICPVWLIFIIIAIIIIFILRIISKKRMAKES